MKYWGILLSISLLILTSCAEMAMLDKLNKNIPNDLNTVLSDSTRLGTATVTKTRLYKCADKVVDGERYILDQ